MLRHTTNSQSDLSAQWKRTNTTPSFPEAHSSIHVPLDASWVKKFLAFLGPGLLVAVGYMDPGNWATGIEGGSRFGYMLLSVILISNLFAILLQHLSIKLGVVAQRDLAQACRDHYSKGVNFFLWILCELAIIACDLAEVIGSAIALNLLFHIPLAWGVVITALDVLVILFLQHKGFRYVEIIVAVLIITIFMCFGFEMISAKPSMSSIMKGLVPSYEIIKNPQALYIAIGILGATVMPHNLYLHSSLIQTRNYPRTKEGKKMAIRYASWDSTLSLSLAFFVNAAILILSAAVFHESGYRELNDIRDAYKLLTPLVGSSLASILFAVALLACGQNSTLTGTLAGQIVMEGFLNFRINPWLRRLITRLLAIIPAMIIGFYYGEKQTAQLLVFSQVVLSMQLSFAILPLIKFTSDKKKMGEFTNSKFLCILSYIIAFIIIFLNLTLLYESIKEYF